MLGKKDAFGPAVRQQFSSQLSVNDRVTGHGFSQNTSGEYALWVMSVFCQRRVEEPHSVVPHSVVTNSRSTQR